MAAAHLFVKPAFYTVSRFYQGQIQGQIQDQIQGEIQIKRKLKRKRQQKRKRGSLREGREAPLRRCPHPFRFCSRFRFNFRFFKF